MSVTRPLDGWDRNASQLLRRRIFEGSPDKAVSYAPDWIAATATQPGRPGPLSLQICDILRRHADLWALEMRTRVNPSAEGGRIDWLVQMREADAEIKRFLAGHKLKGAA